MRIGIPIIILSLFLSGCSGTDIASSLVQLPTGEIVSSATDRFGSWERVEISRHNLEISNNDLELAKLDKQAKEPQVTIVIDSAAELEAYERLESVKALSKANDMLGKAVVALAEKDKPAVSDATPFPKGAFAEGIESFGKAGKDILSTPASGIVAGGYALGKVLDGYDSGTNIDTGGGDLDYTSKDIEIGNSNTDTTSYMTESADTTNNTGD